MYVLGVETSCDETAAAVVKDGKVILSSVVSSSSEFHEKYGGIIPEIAFRMQLETITQVADNAIHKAGVKLRDIKLISVTGHPGLFGSLVVGRMFAKGLNLATGIPLVEVNHLYGHLYACILSNRAVKLPFVALIISGGHTSLFYVKDFDSIKLLGSTLDDASGEAFDKVAKILGLGYPGGPAIEKLALKGNEASIRFNCSDTDRPLDFSFSGIKTAVLYYVNNAAHRAGRTLNKADIAASFQDSVINLLIDKALSAVKSKKVKTLLIGGGVAANNKLRDKFLKAAECNKISAYFPSKSLCMDNAAMIAGFGYQLFKKKKFN